MHILEDPVDNDRQISAVPVNSSDWTLSDFQSVATCNVRRYTPTANMSITDKTRRCLDPTAGPDVAANINILHLPRINLKLAVT